MIKMRRLATFLLSFLALSSQQLMAAGGDTSHSLGMTTDILGYSCVFIFCFAYIFVILEEKIHLRKSKPVVLAAGLIWVIVAYMAQSQVDPSLGEEGVKASTVALKNALNHNLVEYAELLLFLLVAMTYINAMQERYIFRTLRYWLIKKGFSYKQLFWITGFLAFFISPIADNLTTALLLGAVVMTVGAENKKFAGMACVNIVVAANAGGAFSPFGDITTLMVWQKGKVEFFQFFALFVPSLVNFIVPSTIMSFFIPNEQPSGDCEKFVMKKGAKRIMALFLITIAHAVGLKQLFHLPPYMGMMVGMALLLLFGYYLKMRNCEESLGVQFNVFNKVEKAEWDTLFFFFGVIYCVGGLGYIGYLESVSSSLYTDLGPSTANIAAGLLSAIVDNIPVMFAILQMNPDMGENLEIFQWLLVTLTAGTGGSLLAVGSAAGVALMGQAKGVYTFMAHLKWIWAIALGYAASIWVHFLINYP